jgi:hypothetical protein
MLATKRLDEIRRLAGSESHTRTGLAAFWLDIRLKGWQQNLGPNMSEVLTYTFTLHKAVPQRLSYVFQL